MSNRKPKQPKAMQDLKPKHTDAVKAGSGVSPADAAQGSLSPSEQARLNRPATRTGLSAAARQ
jgi:hypothetical protein